jgi:predicted GNAT family N-acyltransferase
MAGKRVEARRGIIKQESARNDLVASGRITFPPTLLPPRRGDALLSRLGRVLVSEEGRGSTRCCGRREI